MFKLTEQTPITIEEFLKDYDLTSWIAYIKKDPDRVRHGQWTVERAAEKDYTGKKDIYLNYNPLKGYVRRKKKNIGRLALLYVDLDIGHVNPFVDFSKVDYKQEVIDVLIRDFFDKVIPAPSYVCDSGRGLYLIYKIYQNEDQTKQEHFYASERWERVNSFLTNALKDYCADSAVSTDEARVLRVPGSINSHSGTVVKFYQYSDKTYTLYNIERDYINEPTEAQIEKLGRVEDTLGIKCQVRNRRSIRKFLERHEASYRKICNKKSPTERQIKFASDIAKVLNLNCPKFRTAGGADRFIKKNLKAFKAEKAKRRNHSTFIKNDDEKTLKMLEMRLKRIEKVLIDAPADSYREKGLFLYRLFACEYEGDKKLAEVRTLELLRSMSNPLPEKEAMRTTRSAERYWESGHTYRISDSRLADHFGLTAEEWRDLIPYEVSEDKELRKARNHRYYENKLNAVGEKSKSDKIKERREKMARLLVDGRKKEEICHLLGISERTYYNDLKSAEEIAQDIVKSSAKNLDGISNSGPVGPIDHTRMVLFRSTSVSVFNPFTEMNEYMYRKDSHDGWISLFRSPPGEVALVSDA